MSLKPIFFTFAASILVLAAIAPADRIDNIQLNLSLFTPMGSLHAGSVLIFVFASPMVIVRLFRALQAEPKYQHLAVFTATVGTIACIASIMWMVLFGLGVFLEYRGIFQKLIVLFVMGWMMLMNITAFRTKGAT